MRPTTALRWLALPLALGLITVAFEHHAEAAPAKGKRGKKKPKPTGGSMDDNAGRDVDVGGTAPGTSDSKSAEPEVIPETPKKPKPTDAEPEEVKLEEDDAPAEAAAAPSAPSPFSLNWISVNVQQNFMIYGTTNGVCPSVDDQGKEYLSAPGYSCRDANSIHRGDVYAGGGNQVKGGFGLADLRFTLGYDRVLGNNLMLGGRFGIAILQAPSLTGTKAPMPFHGEAHLSYYFGDTPFMNQGLRPFAGFALGVAEVDSKVSVVYFKDHVGYQTNRQGRLDAWRQTGPFFAAATGGFSYPMGSFMATLELRVAAMFGTFALSPSAGLGLAYGF